MARTSRNNMEDSSFFHIMVQGINKENNPVKARICMNRENYKFSSYINIYAGNQNEVVNRIGKSKIGGM